ncbi:helix-turn-helix transcriptional regulator [Acaryochloris sp. CCMEE 5410]|uniref:helix-turn-helix transcriptional regulator n=1 Tax=Acaryochloris sp. CCMEE 5410 TaxID=310037 RepID=UPI0037C16E19
MSSDWSACPPHPQESLKDYVCRLRQQQNWTQAQLATAAGVHRQTIGKIEKGQLNASINGRETAWRLLEHSSRVSGCPQPR